MSMARFVSTREASIKIYLSPMLLVSALSTGRVAVAGTGLYHVFGQEELASLPPDNI